MSHIAKVRIIHDDKEYAIGTALPELSDVQVTALLELGAIELDADKQAATKTPSKGTKGGDK